MSREEQHLRHEAPEGSGGRHGTRGYLGNLSEEFETGSRGPETVSSGKIGKHKLDPGGVSYGTFQMTSKPAGGTVKEFIHSPEGKQWEKEFHGLEPGSEKFTDKWKDIAKDHPEELRAAEYQFIGRTKYNVQADHIQDRTGVDIRDRSEALQNTVFSTSVHHGQNTRLVGDAFNETAKRLHKKPEELTDKECIDAIYAKRIEVTGKQPELHPRFHRERERAHEFLSMEQGEERVAGAPPGPGEKVVRREQIVYGKVLDGHLGAEQPPAGEARASGRRSLKEEMRAAAGREDPAQEREQDGDKAL